MNILFISLIDFNSIEEHGIYTDLLCALRDKGNNIFIMCPVEKRSSINSFEINEPNCRIVKFRIGNVQKTNIIEKGISTITLESRFIKAIKKYFSNIRFDLVLYPTPPITFCGAVEYVKNRDNARAYLMLKDIFPQNAVDMGMLSKTGIKGVLYSYFRAKEERLYRISDKIGCMSQANVDYIMNHNPQIPSEKLEVFPNCIEVVDKSVSIEERDHIRAKYGIPSDKTVFVYGGNLGRPQSVEFIIDCLKSQVNNEKVYFLIVGDGTDYHLLEEYMQTSNQANVKLMQRLPKEDYDTLVGACDVGMIFLDYRFTIPNFPSRLLSYMQAKLPVLAVTDVNTDIGKIIVDGGFGWWCPSNSVEKFCETIDSIVDSDFSIGDKGFEYLEANYNVDKLVNLIIDKTVK